MENFKKIFSMKKSHSLKFQIYIYIQRLRSRQQILKKHHISYYMYISIIKIKNYKILKYRKVFLVVCCVFSIYIVCFCPAVSDRLGAFSLWLIIMIIIILLFVLIYLRLFMVQKYGYYYYYYQRYTFIIIDHQVCAWHELVYNVCMYVCNVNEC